MMRLRLILGVLLAAELAAQQKSPDVHVIDIGTEQDRAYLGEGFHGPEGPYPVERHGTFHAQPFRWTKNSFVLTVPTFPGKDNVVLMHMKVVGGDDQKVLIESDGRPLGVLPRAKGDHHYYQFVVPAGVVGKKKLLPLTFRAAVPRKKTGRPNAQRVLFCAVAKVSISPREPASGSGAADSAAIAVMPIGDSLYLSNGVLALWCGEPKECMASIFLGAQRAGRLKGVVVQFEKEGVGYKGTGIGWAAAEVKSVVLDSKDSAKAVLNVTVERTRSMEAGRAFEAVYRLTVPAGKPFLESRLVRIKNTDSVAFEVRGYYHKLQPANRSAKPCVFPNMAVWLLPNVALGAVTRTDGDFLLSFRREADGRPQGEIARKVGKLLKPGETWQADGPGVLIFVTKKQSAEAIFKEALTFRRADL